MLSVCPSPSSSSSSTSSPRVATSARGPSCCVYVHPPPLPHPHHQPISTPRFAPSERQKGLVQDSLPCSLCPSSSFSSSPSSPTYLNTPSCPISTTWCTAVFLISMSIILFLLLLIISITIISNLPQHPELLHQHDLVHGGLLAVYVHHSLPPPPPPHHHHLKPTSTPRVAPSARLSCSLCPPSSSLSLSSSSSSSSPTYLNTPSCPISTAWCTAAFLLSMCPFSLHHMRCGG